MEAADGDFGIGLLPYDLFADILRHLPSRDLAESRRVCRAWRAAVDATALLPARLHRFFPPRAFPGVFVCRRDAASSFFAAPPPSRSSRGGTNNGGGGDDSEPAAFRYPLFHYGWATVTGHCNGLLLLGEDQDEIFLDEGRCVCNPATGRCARLPPVPRSADRCDGIFLAFDPAVSRHHEVFLFPQSTTQLRPDKEEVVRPPIDEREQEEAWTEISSEQLHSFNLFEEEKEQSEVEEEGQVQQLEEQRPQEPQLEEEPKEDEGLMCLINLFEEDPQHLSAEDDEVLLCLISLFEEDPQQLSAEDDEMLSLTNLFEEEGQVQLLEDQPQQPQPQVEEPKQDEVLSVMVFSSRTNQWESRDFLPGRCAPGLQLCEVVIASRLLRVYGKIWLSAEYWRGSLYLHCRNNILMILRSSRRTYDMIQLPWSKALPRRCVAGLPTRSVLASYNQGVRYVALDVHDRHTFQLQVWTLDEPADDGQLGWTLTHKADLSAYAYQMDDNHSPSLPTQSSMVLWEPIKSCETAASLFEKLPDYYYDIRGASSIATGMTGAEEKKPRCEEDLEYSWNSDEDNFIDVDGSAADTRPEPVYSYGCHGIIGLHQYKDVILLHIEGNAAAYHLSTSRMQYLGQLVKKRPRIYNDINHTFPYRPCYVDSLPAGKMSRCYDYD